MSRHTPGPWTMDEGIVTPEIMRDNLSDSSDWVAVGTEDEEGFAESVAYSHPQNARLIAAAPELLAMAREVAAVGEHAPDNQGPCLCSQCARTRLAAELVARVETVTPEKGGGQ